MMRKKVLLKNRLLLEEFWADSTKYIKALARGESFVIYRGDKPLFIMRPPLASKKTA